MCVISVCGCMCRYCGHEHARAHASLVAMHTRTRSKQKLLAVFARDLASFLGVFCCRCVCFVTRCCCVLTCCFFGEYRGSAAAQGLVVAALAAPVIYLSCCLAPCLFPYFLRAFAVQVCAYYMENITCNASIEFIKST